MEYNIFEYTDENSYLDIGFGGNPQRKIKGGSRPLYHAHLAVDGDKIIKNHTRFTDTQIRQLTNNLTNLERINKNYYLLIQ